MDTTFKPYARCSICTNARVIDDFRILSPCAHSICTICIKSWFVAQGSETCPMCRIFVGSNVENFLKMVHVDFVPSKVVHTELVVEGLSRMNKDSKIVSVLRTPAKLQKVAGELELDEGLAKSILQAVSEFRERIVPLYAESNAQRDQLHELQAALDGSEDRREQINELTAKLRKKEKQELEMRRTQQQVETERDRAVEMAEKAIKELNTARSDNTSLEERVAELGTEIATLKGYLQQYKIAERKNKAKRREMQRRLTELEQKVGNYEEAASKTLSTVPKIDVDLDNDSNNLTSMPRTNCGERDNTHPIPLALSEPRFDFEGMPGPGFSSNRNPGEHRNVKRIKLSNDKVKEITNFPLSLDRSGHPTVPIQLGPKRKLRVSDPLK